MGGKKENDDWIVAALALGLGILAIHLLKKLSDKSTVQSSKPCIYCGYETDKWSRTCSKCRNTFPM